MSELVLAIIKITFLGLFSFSIALATFPFLYWLLLKLKAGKTIRAEGAPIFKALHQKKAGTPTMGGVLLWLIPLILAAFFSISAKAGGGVFDWLNFLNRRETLLPLAFLVLAGIVGGLDDIVGILRLRAIGGLRVREKLLIYLGFSILIAWWLIVKLGITFIYIPFFGRLYLGPIWFSVFIIFFILATSFSANETDGLDGLLGGIATIAIFFILIVAFLNGDYNLSALCSALLGTLIGFLWFNIYPAKVFMGDTGSMALGIFIGLASIISGITLLLPLMLPIFVLESGSVIIQTFWKKVFKRKLFLSTPIHHHFEALGNEEANIVFKFWIVNLVGTILAFIIFILDKSI